MTMRIEYKPSGSGSGGSKEPLWQFYKQLEFLALFLKHRPTLGNLSKTTDDLQVMTAAVFPPVPIEVDQLATDDGECTSNSIESTNADNSLEVGPISKKRAKRNQEKGNNMTAILTALESSNEVIMSASNKQEPDADNRFGESIGKELKELTGYYKSHAKLRIQQLTSLPFYFLDWETLHV